MPKFHHIIVHLPGERKLQRAAITSGVNDLFHELAQEGEDVGRGTIRIRSYYNRHYLRDEALITWDQSE